MSFRNYLRWDGLTAIVIGLSLVAVGLAEGHQGPVDAASSGAVIIAGTGLFMRVRHKVPFRRPGTWFTLLPLAAPASDRAACEQGRPLGVALVQTAAAAVIVEHEAATGVTYRIAHRPLLEQHCGGCGGSAERQR